MQRNIIYILLFILFCQCTSTMRKDIKWIAITDIYEEFGIDSYDIEFEEFYFVDENTLILSGFKGIGTPSRTSIVFISKQAEDIYFEQRGNIKENGEIEKIVNHDIECPFTFDKILTFCKKRGFGIFQKEL